ncbi:MAG TPA: sensor histidine kinase, partial [Elusimicrobiota bacterium]|nr:sensor histidine kinase [Elusimicrobiota bacterium]
AVRFAHERVVVRVGGGDAGAFELSVHDDGVGIPPEKMDVLFTRFNQLERARGADGRKGTGLGLAICKEIAALHRGRIDVASAPGTGTTFRLVLPAGAPAPPPPPHGAMRGGADEGGSQ